ncbi:RidA family protein [Scleromatobacter humisilvae]|uniref:RidA family protein n=1 Tax=Scleromatobacter humisilvae TaxID=2897159 RepID=A0A9X1YL09_9BURK|nr:RidA family protein [Scleromatobacter humisilvae]MCK9688118.1 RidA family protein [Scleromatobacter humisilvae]
MKSVLQPEGWPRPRGYANGVSAQGRQVFVAGMVGWNAASEFDSDDLVDQVRQALANVKAVLAEAGARPEHMVRMTWYVVDRADYLARGRDIGAAYREVMGQHYDVAMSAVEVSALMEARAKVEIEVTAVVPQAL